MHGADGLDSMLHDVLAMLGRVAHMLGVAGGRGGVARNLEDGGVHLVHGCCRFRGAGLLGVCALFDARHLLHQGTRGSLDSLHHAAHLAGGFLEALAAGLIGLFLGGAGVIQRGLGLLGHLEGLALLGVDVLHAFLELLHHMSQTIGQHAEFVGAGVLQFAIKVALGNGACELHAARDRAGNSAVHQPDDEERQGQGHAASQEHALLRCRTGRLLDVLNWREDKNRPACGLILAHCHGFLPVVLKVHVVLGLHRQGTLAPSRLAEFILEQQFLVRVGHGHAGWL